MRADPKPVASRNTFRNVKATQDTRVRTIKKKNQCNQKPRCQQCTAYMYTNTHTHTHKCLIMRDILEIFQQVELCATKIPGPKSEMHSECN